MKMIIAFIKPNRFDDVILALHRIEGLSGASVSDVRGFGRDRAKHDDVEKTELSMDVKTHLRLEIACHDELADTVLSTLEWTANTGLRGDGKIYILPLEQAVRISSGERGEDAV